MLCGSRTSEGRGEQAARGALARGLYGCRGNGHGGFVRGTVSDLYGVGEFGGEDGVKEVVSFVVGVEVDGKLFSSAFECLEGGKIGDVIVFVCDGGDASK